MADMKRPDPNESDTVRENAVDSADHARNEHSGVALFLSLRGMGAGMFDSAGRSEAWLAAERGAFYGESKKQLDL